MILGGYQDEDWTSLENGADHSSKEQLFRLRRDYQAAEALWRDFTDEELEAAYASEESTDEQISDFPRVQQWLWLNDSLHQAYHELGRPELMKVRLALTQLQRWLYDED
ncbi:MAG TPA: hypothetical protein VFE47_16820 [Tepidisphaeraceae bacterium]|nr:hypothetical protein [Tepidisphaeraceae bacterium]